MFGSSPDETAYCRLYLNRETTADALTMMQPQLLAYTMEVRSLTKLTPSINRLAVNNDSLLPSEGCAILLKAADHILVPLCRRARRSRCCWT